MKKIVSSHSANKEARDEYIMSQNSYRNNQNSRKKWNGQTKKNGQQNQRNSKKERKDKTLPWRYQIQNSKEPYSVEFKYHIGGTVEKNKLTV